MLKYLKKEFKAKKFIRSRFFSLSWLVSWRTAVGLRPEETPPTAQTATPRGVGREPWLQNRNGTSTKPVTLRRAKSPSRLGGNGETAVLRGGRANRRR